MRKAIILLSALVLILIYGCNSSRIEDYVTFASVDPLEKVMKESTFFAASESAAEAGIGEYPAFQFALRASVPLNKVRIKIEAPRNGKVALPLERKGLVKYVHVSRLDTDPARDRISSLSGFYPDPIADLETFDLRPEETQPVWLTFRVPPGTAAGEYSGHVKMIGRIAGKRIKIIRNIRVTVYPVDLSSTSLKVTNWFFDNKLSLCNNGEPVEPFSEKYWELIKMLANTMSSYRQNVAWIDPLRLVNCRKTSDGWTFDFDDFNRMARLLISTGSISQLEGTHLAVRESNWESRFVMRMPVTRDSVVKMAVTDSLVKEFYMSFIPALKQDLTVNGWDQSYIQHIADEPITANAESYKTISAFIKNCWPGVRIVEACHSHDLTGFVDIWVPQLDLIDKDYDFYKSRQDSSEEVWFYTCLAPKGEYANRFIELPLIKTRLLHWINYRYGITGYLHWGFNYWNDDPWNETTGIITESGNILPGGDSWIVYPGYGKVFPSIRLEAMRDGIADYELLKKYGEKYPEKAAELCRQVIYGFDRYDTDIASFREKRHLMLTELSRRN